MYWHVWITKTKPNRKVLLWWHSERHCHLWFMPARAQIYIHLPFVRSSIHQRHYPTNICIFRPVHSQPLTQIYGQRSWSLICLEPYQPLSFALKWGGKSSDWKLLNERERERKKNPELLLHLFWIIVFCSFIWENYFTHTLPWIHFKFCFLRTSSITFFRWFKPPFLHWPPYRIKLYSFCQKMKITSFFINQITQNSHNFNWTQRRLN